MKMINAKKFVTGTMISALALTTAVGVLPAHAKSTQHPIKVTQRAKITETRANAIVLKKFPGKLTAKTTLENEEGKWEYGVMVRSGKTLREVMVDAYSGKIVSVEVTTAAKEGVEKD